MTLKASLYLHVHVLKVKDHYYKWVKERSLMARYRIAWMAGDGVGNDVMEAAKIVLDAIKFDAEYIPADIGWEFWCKEGNAFPDRTKEILKNTDCALFGAITSKPKQEAEKDLIPEFRVRD